MHPSGRTGVRFVLANPSDPSRLDDFKDWYDTYSAAITVPGYLANDARFENPDASGETTSPRYATTYDIVSPDPATAWPDTEHSPAYPTHLFSDPRASLVTPALRASYALVDLDAMTLTPRRVQYDFSATQKLMKQAKFPDRLIRRLRFGQ